MIPSTSTFTGVTIPFSKMMCIVSVFSVLPAFAVQAQTLDADSTIFRAGQWGAEFTIGTSNVSPSGAGVLRFFSERRALIVNLNGNVSRQSGDSPSTQDYTSLNVQVGTRWYRPVTQHVMQFATIGALVSHEKRTVLNVNTQLGQTSESSNTQSGAGAFAEIGAGWFVTPQLSLGASWQSNLIFLRGKQRTTLSNNTLIIPESRSNVTSASVGALSLRVGVYF